MSQKALTEIAKSSRQKGAPPADICVVTWLPISGGGHAGGGSNPNQPPAGTGFGPGGGGGAGGAGGAAGGSSQPQAPTPSRAVCAANLADKYSIAGAVGTTGKQGFFANVFNGVAGNTFSGLTLAFSGGGNKYRLGTSIDNATFGGTTAAINAVTTPAPITELGLTETVGGEFLGKGLGGIFTLGKLGYDAASFTAAYFSSTCRSGG